MILIGLGSNMHGPWGSPREAVLRALRELDGHGTQLVAASRLLATSPYGRKNQPDFVNAVAVIATPMPPEALMRRLHAIERRAGRRRGIRWGPRTLDLDLLDYHGRRMAKRCGLTLPHPGIRERQFVLKPIAEVAPAWIHPVERQSARSLLRRFDGHRGGAEI
ncbi:MAG: 2-amino-4-hydroxy-6-hydroxymethyldihydropteridine diphosphokinase [Hyphomicrobiales bacterium]